MKFDYRKLIGRIIEKFGSQRAFAQAVGFTETTISKKLSGKMAITTDDIINWSDAKMLDIANQDIPEYFFKLRVQES